MRYFSTFTGIGGFELGIQQAYVETTLCEEKRTGEKAKKTVSEKGKGLHSEKQSVKGVGDTTRQPGEHDTNLIRTGQPTCIGYSETDKYAIQTYEKHFGNRRITKECGEDDKCQPCFDRGDGQGWRPHPYHYQIKGHKNYGDITTINEKELPDFELFVGGFPCQAFSIAGKRGGFKDTRGTLFFDIARIVREKQPRLLLLENVKGLLSHDKGNTFYTIITTLDELGYDLQWQVLNSKNYGVPQNRERVFIIGHLRGTSRPEVFPIGEKGGNNCKIIGRVTGINGHDYLKRIYSSGGSSPTLPTGTGGNHEGKFKIEGKIRRLTPTECERLQGFPDGWTVGVSDTQRYKQLGNAVTVNVVREIMKKILCHSTKSKTKQQRNSTSNQ